MKRIFSIKHTIMALALGTVLINTGCDKDDDPAPQPQAKTVTQTVVDDPAFSILEAAVVRAGLADTLANTPNLTVFAPNNDAFIAAGLTEAVVNNTPVLTLKSILKYHVLTTRIASSGVPSTQTELSTFGGPKAYANKSGANVFINGARVLTADVSASNGVIHVINRVLIPPPGNIVAVASANPNFSYLVAAIGRAGASGTDIAAALSGTGPFTVFAPTNDAFINAGFPTIASIQAASATTLRDILLYHVVPARVFSTDLTEGAQPGTLFGANKLTITLTGGAKVKGNGNATAANITGVDVMATNGVIHVIDKVLLP
jgi:uncharacterized surface protein with fasciclin (FAS1) repeats